MAGICERIRNRFLRWYFRYADHIFLPWKTKRILIVRTDGIGDYLLFRNFLPVIMQSARFSGYKFSLLGNVAYKSLVDTFDQSIFEDCFWISPSRFFSSGALLQRALLSLTLKAKAFDYILVPMHSRIFVLDEFIAKIGGKYLIASQGDNSNYHNEQQYRQSFKYYDELIEVPDAFNFEFERNSSFAAALCKSPTSINYNLPVNAATSNQPTIIIFPGAGAVFRQWKPKYFANVINQLFHSFGNKYHFVIAGDSNDEIAAQEIKNLVDDSAILSNKVGTMNLHELAIEIENACLLISNETCAIHFAAAVHTAYICLSNGNHFGRFTPYPLKMVDTSFTFYPNNAFYIESERLKMMELCRFQSPFNINDIDPDAVANKARQILQKILQ